MTRRTVYLLIGGGVGILAVLFLVWLFFPSSSAPQGPGGGDGLVTPPTTGGGGGGGSTPPIVIDTGDGNTPAASQRIFKIADGPVAGAVFLESYNPTTTTARWVDAANGHVFDLAIGSPGAVVKAVSNTTIPGVLRALWGSDGTVAIVQYLDTGRLKTASLAFPVQTATSTAPKPPTVRFFPDNIRDIAISPNGALVVYVRTTETGVAGYTSQIDGSGEKTLFTFPLSEVRIAWPVQSTIILSTKRAAGAPGAVLSIDASTGASSILLSEEGLTATVTRSFAYMLYNISGRTLDTTYAKNLKTGASAPAPFAIFPEQCTPSNVRPDALFCASPNAYASDTYLDQKHRGEIVSQDRLVWYNLASDDGVLFATPGGRDGGISSDVLALFASPRDQYLGFIENAGRSLWGVRLSDVVPLFTATTTSAQ